MRELKFRGRDIDTGEFVYAELGGIVEEIKDGYFTFRIANLPVVEISSIAQLVGYDQNGQEIYEGDELVSDDPINPHVYTARLESSATSPDGCYITGKMFNRFRLKEAAT